MLTKTLLVSVLIGITAANKSFYSSRNCSESEILRAKNTKLLCVSKLEAYQAMVGHVKDKLDQFYQQFDSAPLGLVSWEGLLQNRTEFERRISVVISSFASHIKMLNMVQQNRLDHCRTSLEKAAKQIENLSNSMKELMKEITYELMNSSLPRTTVLEYIKPITLATRITIALDLSIKASQGLMKLSLWMKGKVVSSGAASNLVSSQESTVDEFELILSKILKKELGVANVGAEASEAVQKGADAVVEHLRLGQDALQEVKEAERAQLIAAHASDEAAWLTEIAASSGGASEEAVTAARKAQANRARQMISAVKVTRHALATRVRQALKIAEIDDEAKATLVAMETSTEDAVKSQSISEGAAVARAALRGTIFAGAAVGFVGAAATTFDLVVPPAVGVVALIYIAIVANEVARDELLKEHADQIFANPLIKKRQFGMDMLNWLLVTINVQHY